MDDLKGKRPEVTKEVNTYNPQTVVKKPKKTVSKGIFIFLAILLVIVVLGVSCNMGLKTLGQGSGNAEESYAFDEDYIGLLHVEGTIGQDTGNSLVDSATYHHSWTLQRIDDMINDDHNKGMVIYVDTPGGSVYATDELYYKIKEYKKTGRPVYSAMGSMAASGGYYMSAPCDKIIANRNCWTGSIGVTIGTLYDITGFLDKLGVKTVTITSGKNKAMGSVADPLTKEQKAIFQGLVDDAYMQFVDVVATGRDMKVAQVKKVADGRVYTAKQAKANGLIDDIGTLQDAVEDMKTNYQLLSCKVEDIKYTPKTSLSSLLLSKFTKNDSSIESQYDQLVNLMGENNKFTITYMANIQK